MLGWHKIRIAGSEARIFNTVTVDRMHAAYDDSNVVTDFRLVLYNIQPSDKLHENVSKV